MNWKCHILILSPLQKGLWGLTRFHDDILLFCNTSPRSVKLLKFHCPHHTHEQTMLFPSVSLRDLKSLWICLLMHSHESKHKEFQWLRKDYCIIGKNKINDTAVNDRCPKMTFVHYTACYIVNTGVENDGAMTQPCLNLMLKGEKVDNQAS